MSSRWRRPHNREVRVEAFDGGFQLGEAASRFGDGLGAGGAAEEPFGFEAGRLGRRRKVVDDEASILRMACSSRQAGGLARFVESRAIAGPGVFARRPRPESAPLATLNLLAPVLPCSPLRDPAARPLPPAVPCTKSATVAQSAQSPQLARMAAPLEQATKALRRYAKPLSGYAEPFGGYAQPFGRYAKPFGRYAEPLRAYAERLRGYAKRVRRYAKPVRQFAEGLRSHAEGLLLWFPKLAKFFGNPAPPRNSASAASVLQ